MAEGQEKPGWPAGEHDGGRDGLGSVTWTDEGGQHQLRGPKDVGQWNEGTQKVNVYVPGG